MSDGTDLLRDLVAGNRILAHENIVDSLGHISVRHPSDSTRYYLSCARSPALVEPDDIMEFTLDNAPVRDDGRAMYIERPIHGAIYAARPDVMSIVHNHCLQIMPFAVTKTPLRPIMAGARAMGGAIGVWDIQDKFGDTDLLVTTNDQGADLAGGLGGAKAIMMRGHGCVMTGGTIQQAVNGAIAMRDTAATILAATMLGGTITYLTEGELQRPVGNRGAGQGARRGPDRTWEYLCHRAGVSI